MREILQYLFHQPRHDAPPYCLCDFFSSCIGCVAFQHSRPAGHHSPIPASLLTPKLRLFDPHTQSVLAIDIVSIISILTNQHQYGRNTRRHLTYITKYIASQALDGGHRRALGELRPTISSRPREGLRACSHPEKTGGTGGVDHQGIAVVTCIGNARS